MDKPVIYLTPEQVGFGDNAHIILARVKRAMRQLDVPEEVIIAYRTEALSGDYEHLQQVTREWCGIEDEQEGVHD